MKNLKELDIFKQNPDNKITGEAIENPPQDVPVYLIHDIFFGESLKLYTDPAQPDNSALVLNQDYICTQEDSIATEQAEKDCFRAVIFKAAYIKVYADYWVYGDTVSAKAYNDVVNIATDNSAKVDNMLASFNDLKNTTEEHIRATQAHEASADIVPDRIVMRTAAGSIHTPEATDDSDAVPYGMLKAVDDKVEAALSKIKNEASKRFADIQTVTKKIIAQTQVISAADFLPEGVTWDDATDTQKQDAEQSFTAHMQKTDAYHNVLRNQNGSIIVPEAQTDYEAANRITVADIVNARIASLIDNAPEELDTLKELADALKNNQSGIASINTALTNRYTKQEADKKFVMKEPGKGLSSNDYTNEEKQKLASINLEGEGLATTLFVQEHVKTKLHTCLFNYFKNTHYIQYPNKPNPEQIPLLKDVIESFPDYRWAVVDYHGCFFRAVGGNASVFNSGIQAESLPNIMGSFAVYSGGITSVNGVFTKNNYGSYWYSGGSANYSNTAYFEASHSNPIYGRSSHVTPENHTIKYWQIVNM